MFFRLPDWLRFEMREKWERLQDRCKELPLRRWINDNPRIVIAITTISACVLLLVVITLLWPKGVAEVELGEKEWFYDLNTGKLFTAKKGLTPPIEAPSGPLPDGRPAGVRAYVLTYAYEPNESERFIGFLETTNPRGEDDSTRSSHKYASGFGQWGKGKLIRRVEDEQWVPADSRLGQAIFQKAFIPNENGEHPYYCPPK
jgi:hypothetical protein